MSNDKKRFQLFLYNFHDVTAEASKRNEVSLSTEVRNRVARSFWQDELLAEMRRRGDCADLLEFLDDEKRKFLDSHRG